MAGQREAPQAKRGMQARVGGEQTGAGVPEGILRQQHVELQVKDVSPLLPTNAPLHGCPLPAQALPGPWPAGRTATGLCQAPAARTVRQRPGEHFKEMTHCGRSPARMWGLHRDQKVYHGGGGAARLGTSSRCAHLAH